MSTQVDQDTELETAIAAEMGDETPPAGGGATPPSDEPQPGDDDQAADVDDDQAADVDDESSASSTSSTVSSEDEIEQAMKKLEKEATRHTNRVVEIMGDDAETLVECPLCVPNIPGFRFDVVPDEPQLTIVKRAIGLVDLERYKHVNDVTTCDTCGGEGVIATGSKVNGQQTIKCLSCNNRGWTSANPQRVGTSSAPAAATYEAPGELVDENTPPEPLPDADPWGRLPDDADYGRLPNFVR